MIVLWTANTERFCDVREGLNDTADNLLASIKRDEEEVSPSTLFAVASILEGVSQAKCKLIQSLYTVDWKQMLSKYFWSVSQTPTRILLLYTRVCTVVLLFLV